MHPNKHVRSSVLSGSMLWRGFAWKFFPPSQGIIVQQSHRLKPYVHKNTLPLYVYVSSQVKGHAWLQGFRQSIYDQNSRFSKKIRLPNADTFTHHSHHQHASHKHFQEWIANFSKGDSRSQKVVDLEATCTWEMLFHSHNTCTFIQNFSNITLLIRLH